MPPAAPSASDKTAANLFQPLTTPSSSQLCESSLSFSLSSSQSLPMSLRKMPCTILDEIRQLQQQKHQFEELKHEHLQLKQEHLLEATVFAMQSQNMSQQQQQKQQQQQQQQDALLLQSFKKQNAVLWECIKRYEGTIESLEENQSRLSQANAKLEVDLRNQVEINKNLIQRNTDIVLDTSAKDQQISVLKEQRKCLTKQNKKLKNFLRQTDSCLDTLQSQQYLLQQQQEKMQQNVSTADNGASSSASKKRKRNNRLFDERDCDDAKEGKSSNMIKGNDTGKDSDGSDSIIAISSTSTIEDDVIKDNQGKNETCHPNGTKSNNT